MLSGYLKIGSFIHMHPYAKRFRQTAAVVLALLEPEHHLGKEFGPLVTFEAEPASGRSRPYKGL